MLDDFLDFSEPYIQRQGLSLKLLSSLINLASKLAPCFYIHFSGIMGRPPRPCGIYAGAKGSKLQSSCLYKKCAFTH